MRHLLLQLNANTNLEIHNDWTGKEKIFVNGELVSEKRSFFGYKHTFTVEELGYMVNYEVNIFLQLVTGVGFEIKRNGTLLMSNRAGTGSGSDKSAWTFAAIVALLVAGFGVGFGLMQENYKLIMASLAIVGLVYIAKGITNKLSNSSKA